MLTTFKEGRWVIPVIDPLLLIITTEAIVVAIVPSDYRLLMVLFVLFAGIVDGMWIAKGRLDVLASTKYFDDLAARAERNKRLQKEAEFKERSARLNRPENVHRLELVSSLWQ